MLVIAYALIFSCLLCDRFQRRARCLRCWCIHRVLCHQKPSMACNSTGPLVSENLLVVLALGTLFPLLVLLDLLIASHSREIFSALLPYPRSGRVPFQNFPSTYWFITSLLAVKVLLEIYILSTFSISYFNHAHFTHSKYSLTALISSPSPSRFAFHGLCD